MTLLPEPLFDFISSYELSRSENFDSKFLIPSYKL